MKPSAFLALLVVVGAVGVWSCADDRTGPAAPKATAPVFSRSATNPSVAVMEQGPDRVEFEKQGQRTLVRHYRNGQLFADGFIQDKNNGRMTFHAHGLNVFISLDEGVASIKQTGKAKSDGGSVSPLWDSDGDGYDDETGEYVGQSCCGAEVMQLKRDGSAAIVAYAGLLATCGLAAWQGGVDVPVDIACGVAVLAFGVATYWVEVDVDLLSDCIMGHPGCTNWACGERTYPWLAMRKETRWQRIS